MATAALATFAALTALTADAPACSTFCIRNGALVFARNYDWNVADCLVTVNKAGAVKVAAAVDRPARWTSRFGSVTFNQYGREFPNGGMNEAGLVVELMWLEATDYPAVDRRPALRSLQWIQYQLDNCATVDEVVESDERVRIVTGSTPLHFLVADAGGEVAAIEFLDGRLVVHRDDDLPYPALTNTTYEASVRYARRTEALGGTRPMKTDNSSLSRFVRAAHFASTYVPASNGDAIAAAFETLEALSQGGYTQWSVVYDLESRAVFARTRLSQPVKHLRLDALDFGCDTPVRVVDLNTAQAGDLEPQLAPYSEEANVRLLLSTYSQTSFLRDVPEMDIRRHARYPRSVTCAPEDSR